MRKKIDVRDLQKGLYVAELDRPWLETPFLFQGFELRSLEEMAMLKKHCKYVYIDTELGPDIKIKPENREILARMRILEEEHKKITRAFRQLAEQGLSKRNPPPYPDATTFEEEIVEAKAIEREARDTVYALLEDAEKGKIDLKLAKKSVERMTMSAMRNPDALICLSHLKEVSEYAALHSLRTCILVLAFGRHLVYTKEEIFFLGLGAMLHDIGMVKVPKEIMDKPRGLSIEEFETIKKHTMWGSSMASEAGCTDRIVLDMIEQHHERNDGSGYRQRLKDKMITSAGAIGSIIDVYDAVTSDRDYAGGLSAEDALKRLYEWRHKDFRAEYVEEFIKCMGIFPIGSLVELNTRSIGVVVTINRSRRLKPKVALVLTPSLTPYLKQLVIDLMDTAYSSKGKEVKIKRVLPAGTHGINPMDHIIQL